MDSILVVFYSYTGISRRLANMLHAHKGWPVGEIVEDKPRSGNLRCALDALLLRRPAITYKGPEPTDFRTVVLVAPVWFYRLAGPMRSFVHERRDDLKRVAVLMTMGSRGASNAAAEIGRILGHDPILSEAVTAREVEDGSCSEAIASFGSAVQPGGPPVKAARPALWSPEAG